MFLPKCDMFLPPKQIRYQSFWTLTGNTDMLNSQELQEVADRLEATVHQVWFAFAQQMGITPLSGTTDEGHMRADQWLPTLKPMEVWVICKKMEIPAPSNIEAPWTPGFARAAPWATPAVPPPPWTPESPPQCGDGSRRALSAAVVDQESWGAEWRRRVECWFLALPGPTQGGLGACLGALSLHMGSRLESVFRQRPYLSGSPIATPQAEQNCEWINEKSLEALPAFPDMPEDLKHFRLPPIPQLIPSWQRLQSLERYSGGALAKERSTRDDWSPLAAGAGIGAATGAVAMWFLAFRRQKRGAAAPTRLQLRAFGVSKTPGPPIAASK